MTNPILAPRIKNLTLALEEIANFIEAAIPSGHIEDLTIGQFQDLIDDMKTAVRKLDAATDELRETEAYCDA